MLGMDTCAMSKAKMGYNIIDASGSHKKWTGSCKQPVCDKRPRKMAAEEATLREATRAEQEATARATKVKEREGR